MKKGRNPKREEKKLMVKNNLDPQKWLVVKVFKDYLEIRQKETNEIKTIYV